MSNKNLKLRLLAKEYFTLQNILIALGTTIFIIPLILLFIYVANRSWYDALSVGSIIYFLLGLLIIIFNIAEFKTLTKLKGLFAIKKENKEELTSFEKAQMKALNLNKDAEEKVESDFKKQKRKAMFRFVAVFMMILGVILLSISLPFVLIYN